MATEEGTNSGSVPFIVALVSLAAAIAVALILSAQIKALRSEIYGLEFKIRRVAIVLDEVGLTLEPAEGMGGPQAGVVPEPGRSEIQAALDQAKVAAAMGQLRSMQRSFLMHLAESMKPEYPSTDTINTFEDLRRFLFDYLPDSMERETLSWVFLCYYRKSPIDYILVTEAKDSQRTLITVTPSEITPWYSQNQ